VNQEVIEFVPFSVTFTFNGIVSSVSLSEEVLGVVTTFAVDTVTISGNAVDIFPRNIKYVDSQLNLKEMTRFVDLPDEFGSVYSYTPPVDQFKEITVTTQYEEYLTLELLTSIDTLVIRYNFAASNANLLTAIQKGSY
jgi:hypothetical protein